MAPGSQGAGSKPIYSFPELRPTEILQCMEDLRIALNETDLSKPTPATAQRVFEAFVDIFVGVPREAMANGLGLLEMVEYPELHVEAIQLVAFHRACLRLMQEVGVDDFGLRDIIRPEANRFRLILSAVINFAKFREEQLAVFEELNRRSEELLERRAQLAQRRTELAHTLQSIE